MKWSSIFAKAKALKLLIELGNLRGPDYVSFGRLDDIPSDLRPGLGAHCILTNVEEKVQRTLLKYNTNIVQHMHLFRIYPFYFFKQGIP